ncbi:MAG: hypothetical protein ABR612_11910 [Chromatocurvus sp.]
MDPDEVIRALVSVGLVVTMTLGANCQGAAGSAQRPVLEAVQPVLMTTPSEPLGSHREPAARAY